MAGAVPARTLKVITTNLKPGYVRRNGAPYSNRATLTEYWELHTLPNKDEWLTITTKVDDPVYFSRPYLTSSDFKKLPGPAGWNPTPCSAIRSAASPSVSSGATATISPVITSPMLPMSPRIAEAATRVVGSLQQLK